MTTSAQKQANAAQRARNRAHGQALPHKRVRARPVYAGGRHKITRRCFQKRTYMAPGHHPAELANFVGYCLAYAANTYGIQVHACVMMSNHHHTDITDPLAKVPAFMQMFHSMLARGMNAVRPRNGTFWGGGPPCRTTRPTEDETFGDLVYTLTNPVKHAVVKWSHLWTGFTTFGWRFGETRTFTRPDWFFDEDGDMPETVSLTLVRPEIMLELDDNEFYDALEQAIREKEIAYHDEFRRECRRIQGPQKVAKQHWNVVPKSREDRFKQQPKVAASCKWMRLAQLQRDREWEREYAAARELLVAGEPVVFPAGTYWMKHFAGVQVAERAPP